ncbi:MAG TPA: hypothetical protein VGW75_12445 [Solirubrobacteraceae bacterium]|jgi:hypothetical protein|nr:hypothetical protein [Solirubrobacteraceae bacterium]
MTAGGTAHLDAGALERALDEHLASHGAVRDEQALRAVVATALTRAAAAPRRAGGAPHPHADALVRGLRLTGDAAARIATAHAVRGYFDGLVAAWQDDPSLELDELVDVFVAGVWRGLADVGRSNGSRPGRPALH